MPSISIINPLSAAPGFHTSEAFCDDEGGWMQVADLAVVTVAALVPAGWKVRVTDECLSPVDLAAMPISIALTGKVSQRLRMAELAADFRRLGKTVMIGGSYAALNPDAIRPHADILVTGEIEDLAP